MSNLDSLASRAGQLAAKVDFWNSAVVWALSITAIAAIAIVVSQRLAFVRAKKLSDVQESITKIKDASAEQANLKLRTDLETETAKVTGLQTDATNAKVAQQRVEIDLAKQQERAAKAEKDLAQLRQTIQPRHLVSDQESTIIGALSGEPNGPVAILTVLGDGEALDFANEIDRVFKAAGWTVTGGGVSQAVFSGSAPIGFGIVVRNALSAPPYAARIQRAFFSIGIPLGGAENAKLPETTVEIVVGRKPNLPSN